MWKAGIRRHGSLGPRIVAATGLVVMATIAALVLTFDWNWLKSPIEKAVTASTGRRFEINGDLTGEWRWHPRLKMTQVRFANPAWAKEPLLLSANGVEIKIALLPLLRKRLHIHDLALEQPVVYLERLKDGRATWLLDRNQQDEDAAPTIDELRVDQGTLQYLDAQPQISCTGNLSFPAPEHRGGNRLATVAA